MYRRGINYKGLFVFGALLVVSSLFSWKIQPMVHGNDKAVDLIINVFSILAGFLVAIMTLFADIHIGEGENWRSIGIKNNEAKRKYTKNKLLFYGYLVVLALVFVSIVFSKDSPDSLFVVWIERLYLFFAILSFAYSLLLPNKIFKMQQEKIREIQENKKPKSN